MININNDDMDYEQLNREQMLKQLKEQNALLTSIRDSYLHSPVGIYIIQDHRFVWVNTKFQLITGYDESELKNMYPDGLVVHEDRSLVQENSQKMLRGELITPYQFRITDKQGDMHWITESVTSITYQGSRAVLGTFLDISESEGLRIAMDASPIGFYIIQHGKFVYTNPSFQKISGYAENELWEYPPQNLIFPEDRDMVKKYSLDMLKGSRREPYNYRILNKNGQVKWILETVASIRYRGKRAVQGNFMDVTESRKREEALKESEKKYRSLFELAREGITIINFDDGRIIDFNHEFEKQTGYEAAELKNMSVWELQPEEFQEEAKHSFFRFRESHGGIVSWKLCQRREGKILSVGIAAQRLIMEGVEVILCMIRDDTEREAMIRALSLATEEWRQSFDAIDEAVLIIEPDYRIHKANIAAGRLLNKDPRKIIGQKCHQLIHGLTQPPDYCPYLTAQIKGIYSEAEQEEPCLGKILHFSSSPIKDDTGYVSRSVEIITDMSFRRKQEKESARLSAALGESFKGITESLSDLVESRDPYIAGHSKHVAKLSLLAGKKLGIAEDDLHGLEICAILHDIGKVIIPAAILNKPGLLSEHEWGLIRTHPTTAFEALRHIPFPWPVAEIVHQHHERLNGSGYPMGLRGNQIHFWSRIISIADMIDAITSHRPYRPSLPKQNAFDELNKGRGTLYDPKVVDAFLQILQIDDKRILLIDDDQESLSYMMEILDSNGFEAAGFTEPASGLKAFAEKPFPVAIIELNLLNADGAKLTEDIKKISQHTEVIVTTHYGAKEETLRALRAGASDFLEKPMDLNIFNKSIKRAFQRFAGKVQYI